MAIGAWLTITIKSCSRCIKINRRTLGLHTTVHVNCSSRLSLINKSLLTFLVPCQDWHTTKNVSSSTLINGQLAVMILAVTLILGETLDRILAIRIYRKYWSKINWSLLWWHSVGGEASGIGLSSFLKAFHLQGLLSNPIRKQQRGRGFVWANLVSPAI